MHVSTNVRFTGESSTRIQARKSILDDGEAREVRRVFERPDDGRRQGGASRRPRQGLARPRDPEARASEAPLASPRPVVARTEPVPLSPATRASEFWTLLGAVAPETGAVEAAILPDSPVLSTRKPSFQELLARVVAAE